MTDPYDQLSTRVIEAVATAADTRPIALEPPLYRVVDPEALNEIFRADAPARVEFEYAGFAVVVYQDGTVDVDGVTEE